MIDTVAGIALLKLLSNCKDGDVLDRNVLRETIKSVAPRRKIGLSSARHALRGSDSSSNGSQATKNLNRALRYLDRMGVLERGVTENCIIVKDLSYVHQMMERRSITPDQEEK